jgi:(p)ppGpp synthase/HD superfamily hydrolase
MKKEDIMSNTIPVTREYAIGFITSAHEGQWYGDQPYFTHPIAVANNLVNPTAHEYIAALLHDVIEDTEFTETKLREVFGDVIVDMVILLTKDDTLDYRENIQRIIDSGNLGAMKVKLSDNEINITGDKGKMKPDRAEKLNTRYAMSIDMLEAAIYAMKDEK